MRVETMGVKRTGFADDGRDEGQASASSRVGMDMVVLRQGR